ncbi:MAG: hypothetical protein QGI73_05570 [Candidatus Thalassarchaeaceae archaeon]|jgi:UPF0271 protein|nr:DNA-binding protein [Euryarchaeota archaeon]MDP6871679.1 hypothetical protein [Candidatus Thalassarchaeaceae archaeon]|tara:strand:- start:7981 stop:8475 length:495 start_codon:yes stop_codon:yes gene_type:complete
MADEMVLDTSALIEWPVSEISGSFIVPSQYSELERISPERLEMIESIGVIQAVPGGESMEEARKAAVGTGDMSGLSSVDMSLIALALEKSAVLVTDDYRMQNVASHIGIEWRSIRESGISEGWIWELRCVGCKSTQPSPELPNKHRAKFGDCPDCGSELKLRRA